MSAETATDRIRLLSAMLDGTDIEWLELRTPQETIRLRRDAAGVPVPVSPGPAPLTIASPVVGVFLRCHPLQDAPMVRAGQAVQAGDVVGLLRIGALLMHLTAPQAGVVLEVMAEEGSIVGYGTALLHLAAWEGA